jgi:uncharacterized membrane protein
LFEAFSLAFWRGIEVCLLLFPLLLLLPRWERKAYLLLSLLGFLLGFTLLHIPFIKSFSLKLWILKGNILLSGVFLTLSVIAVFGLETAWQHLPWARRSFYFILALALFSLDGLELAYQLAQVVFIKENSLLYLFSLLGASLAFVVGFLFQKLLDYFSFEKVFSLWNFLIYAVGIKIIWEPFIIPSLETLISRVSHDLVHYLVVLLLVPDHPYLTTFFFNLLSIFFRKITSLFLNYFVFLSLSLFLIVSTVTRPLPTLAGLKAAERRKIWAGLKRERWFKVLPVFLALLLFLGLAFQAYTSEAEPYQPIPEPLNITEGLGRIKKVDLGDGMLHVYSFKKGEEVRVIAIRKPDGSMAVCLDVCLICPPDGYAQLESDLFCLYCGTPIPVNTVGEPGGCNPVPLSFQEEEDELTFEVRRAAEVWKEVNKGK